MVAATSEAEAGTVSARARDGATWARPLDELAARLADEARGPRES